MSEEELGVDTAPPSDTRTEEVAEATVPCEFTCGVAGSGKTYMWRERIAANPTDGILAATTGIAAINLSTITINSLLRFFDTDSLRDSYLQGHLVRRLRDIREEYRRIVIDEVSMMDGDQLSLLVRGCLEANSYLSPTQAPPLGLTLVGDFAQLPPIKARWAFESDEWVRFAHNTTVLKKVWRQDAGPFLEALNLCRGGWGSESASILSNQGLEWNTSLDINFDGTTIVPKNDQVDRYNSLALSRLSGQPFTLTSRRWGRERAEWRQIPPRIQLKVGAYVMLLANSYDEGRMVYANGDCGHVTSHSPYSLRIKLVRTGQEVEVTHVTRDVGRKDKPPGWDHTTGEGQWLPQPHWWAKKRRYVEGQVEYWPLRLAYASTVHRSQGLTLDRVQYDIRDHFAGQPAMLYVGISRCRSLAGLRIVGQRERYITQCKIDPRVKPWL